MVMVSSVKLNISKDESPAAKITRTMRGAGNGLCLNLVNSGKGGRKFPRMRTAASKKMRWILASRRIEKRRSPVACLQHTD